LKTEDPIFWNQLNHTEGHENLPSTAVEVAEDIQVLSDPADDDDVGDDSSVPLHAVMMAQQGTFVEEADGVTRAGENGLVLAGCAEDDDEDHCKHSTRGNWTREACQEA